ncbi:MAG: hypothetical protein H6Q53_476 [Deltaproteobacteria bacterium]|nr:hypothetical protein [Deltaproteobacteria bacterium]
MTIRKAGTTQYNLLWFGRFDYEKRKALTEAFSKVSTIYTVGS